MKELYELLTPYSLGLNELEYKLNPELKAKLKAMLFTNEEDHNCLKTSNIYKIKDNLYALTIETTDNYYIDIFIDVANNKIYYSDIVASTSESYHTVYNIDLELYFNYSTNNYLLFTKEFKPIIDSIRLIS